MKIHARPRFYEEQRGRLESIEGLADSRCLVSLYERWRNLAIGKTPTPELAAIVQHLAKENCHGSIC